MQHGSILIGQQHKDLVNYLSVDDDILNSLAAELENKTICLNEIRNESIAPETLMDAIISQLEKNEDLSLNFMEISGKEMISLRKFYNISNQG